MMNWKTGLALCAALTLRVSLAQAHGDAEQHAKEKTVAAANAAKSVPAEKTEAQITKSEVLSGDTASEAEKAKNGMTGPEDQFIEAAKFDQNLNGQVPLDAQFHDDNGKSVTLKEVFKGKPVVLVPMYYKCTSLCSEVMAETVRSAKQISFTTGQQYDIVALSIDPRETPAIARDEKEENLKEYARPEGESGWHFLTGDDKQIHRVTDAIGFGFKYDPKSNQFAHPNGIVVLTPHGKIARYFYGITYPSRDLKFGLMEAATEKIGSPVEKLLLTCFHYDPVTGRYGVLIMSVLRWVSALMVIIVLCSIALSVWREKRARIKPTVSAST